MSIVYCLLVQPDDASHLSEMIAKDMSNSLEASDPVIIPPLCQKIGGWV